MCGSDLITVMGTFVSNVILDMSSGCVLWLAASGVLLGQGVLLGTSMCLFAMSS